MASSLTRADAFNRWLRTLPTINAKMLVAYSLGMLVVCTVCTCLVIGAVRDKAVALDEGILAVICTFVTALAGVGHLDYKAQRKTWSETPPPDESPRTGDDESTARPPEPEPIGAGDVPPLVAMHTYDPRA